MEKIHFFFFFKERVPGQIGRCLLQVPTTPVSPAAFQRWTGRRDGQHDGQQDSEEGEREGLHPRTGKGRNGTGGDGGG